MGSGSNANPAAWAEEAARREHEQNQKAFGDIRAGLLGGYPAICGGIKYRRVSGIIYRLHPNGGFRVQAELEDYCGHSVTLAAPRKVQVMNIDPQRAESGGKAELPDTSQLSEPLKKALRMELPVVCDGEEYRKITAIIYRLDAESRRLRILVERENCGGRIVTAATPRAAEIQNPGTCDELCGIETGKD